MSGSGSVPQAYGPTPTPIRRSAPGRRANSSCPRRTRAPSRFRACFDATTLGRIGEPEEIADMIYFLATGEAASMAGWVVMVDGGVTAHRSANGAKELTRPNKP